MPRQVILCTQKKKQRWPKQDATLANSTNTTARSSLTLKMIKMVFRINDDHLSIIISIMAI